jgi:hypothetical protein
MGSGLGVVYRVKTISRDGLRGLPYSQSKLAFMLFTNELARRLKARVSLPMPFTPGWS